MAVYSGENGSVQKQGTHWVPQNPVVNIFSCTAMYPRTTLPLYQILCGIRQFDMYGIHNPTQSLWSTQFWYSCIPDWSVVVAFSDSSAICDSSLSTLLHICPCLSFQGESKQVLVLHPLASTEYWLDFQLYPHRYYIMIFYIKLNCIPLNYSPYIHYISTIDISISKYLLNHGDIYTKSTIELVYISTI
jgi:hypothetical protein